MSFSQFTLLIPYLVISAVVTGLDFILYIIFLKLIGYYIIANMLSLSIAATTKFVLNKLITFKDRKEKHWSEQFFRFISVSLTGFIISNIFLYILVSQMSLDKVISKIITIGIVFLYTFTMHNLFSFKK